MAGLQTGMPMTALSVLGGQFRLKAQTRAELYQDFLPWALRAGFRSADLMCLYYEKHFEVSRHHIVNMSLHTRCSLPRHLICLLFSADAVDGCLYTMCA